MVSDNLEHSYVTKKPFKGRNLEIVTVATACDPTIRPMVRYSCCFLTRSQAVARIADRTAKNYSGHVIWPRPLSGKLFVRMLGIPNTKLPTKFEISS